MSSNVMVEMSTSLGTIEIELFLESAPDTAQNFLDLVEQSFFDGIVFHRVIPGFVIQGGGYEADAKYREPPKTIKNESLNGLKNDRGTLSMARTNDPHSASSQFFINLRDNLSLDASGGNFGYAVFGKVTNGMDVVDEIALVETGSRQGHQDWPIEAVVIHSARRK